MPIQRRTFDPALQTAASVKSTYTPSNRDVLGHVPGPMRRHAAFVVYGFGATLPKHTPIEDIAYSMRLCNNEDWSLEKAARNRIKGRLSAIRAYCLMCVSGPKAVRMCQSTTCPLHPFRMGNNPFRRKV